MLSLVVMESEKELEEMESADRITDRETMRKIIHRMMPVWEMLEKDNILRDFKEYCMTVIAKTKLFMNMQYNHGVA